MQSLAAYVGLDYHDAGVQVCVLDWSGRILMNRRQANDWRVIAEAVNAVARGTRVHAAIEACTGAANLADELVTKAGWVLDLAHPGFVARMKENPDKHDWGDARIQADLVRVGYLPRVWLAPHEIRELRRLVRYRRQLVSQNTDSKLRIRALLREHRLRAEVKAWTKKWLSWLQESAELPGQSRWIMDQHLKNVARLEADILVVERRLAELTKNDPVMDRLLEQPGIGPITAWTLRAEIGRFDRFRSGKQLSKFCGLSPRNSSTDQRPKTAGLIGTGNRDLRAVLMEAAHRLARYNLHWKRMATSLRAKGKPGSVVAAAVANRWIRRLYHQMQPVQEVA
jgi:transposase